MRTGYVIAVLAGLCAPVMAEDLPPNQILYNTKEVSGIIVRCTKISAIQADCDFFQMAVRKHVTKEDLKKRFAQIDSFMKEPLKKQDCDLFGALAVSLRTGRAVGGAKQELLTQFLNDGPCSGNDEGLRSARHLLSKSHFRERQEGHRSRVRQGHAHLLRVGEPFQAVVYPQCQFRPLGARQPS